MPKESEISDGESGIEILESYPRGTSRFRSSWQNLEYQIPQIEEPDLDNQPSHVSEDVVEAGAVGFTAHGLINLALRKRLKELGLTQDELAKAVDTSTGMVNHFVNLRALPSDDQAQKIALILNIDPKELFPDYLSLLLKPRESKKDSREVPITKVTDEEWQREKTQNPNPFFEPLGNPEEKYLETELKEAVEDVLGGYLSLREKRVLELLFGLKDIQGLGGVEVAEEFGVTAQTISAIKLRAFNRLRKAVPGRILASFLPEINALSSLSKEALINGAINAAYLKNWDRAFDNLDKAERKIISEEEDFRKEQKFAPLTKQEQEFIQFFSDFPLMFTPEDDFSLLIEDFIENNGFHGIKIYIFKSLMYELRKIWRHKAQIMVQYSESQTAKE